MSRCFCAAWSGPPIFCIHKPLPRLNDSGSKPPNRPHVSIMNERSFRFLQPLRDLLHATSLDERRCILCHIPFSPLNRGELPADADNEQRMQIPLCPSCRALLRPRKGGYCPSCGELQPFSDSEPALCETCQKTPPPWMWPSSPERRAKSTTSSTTGAPHTSHSPKTAENSDCGGLSCSDVS